jgi:transcription elongation factor GreB
VSKAFTKEEEEDVSDHVHRVRSSSGLPPGATNYMTEKGARRLRAELAKARGRHAAELRHILESATVVPEREAPPKEVLFGVTVTVRTDEGEQATYRIVGVDELALEKGAVSWVSPLARTLIGHRVGSRVHLPESPAGEEVKVVKIEE